MTLVFLLFKNERKSASFSEGGRTSLSGPEMQENARCLIDTSDELDSNVTVSNRSQYSKAESLITLMRGGMLMLAMPRAARTMTSKTPLPRLLSLTTHLPFIIFKNLFSGEISTFRRLRVPAKQPSPICSRLAGSDRLSILL